MTTDAPWEGNTCAITRFFAMVICFGCTIEGRIGTPPKKATHREVTCYAESRDGVNWSKPNLGLFEFNGSKDNNIVLDGLGHIASWRSRTKTQTHDPRHDTGESPAVGRLGKRGCIFMSHRMGFAGR